MSVSVFFFFGGVPETKQEMVDFGVVDSKHVGDLTRTSWVCRDDNYGPLWYNLVGHVHR